MGSEVQRSASAQLRSMLDDVASGKISPAIATEAMSKWLVMIVAATKNVGIEELIGPGAASADKLRAELAKAHEEITRLRASRDRLLGVAREHMHDGRDE